MRAHAEIPRDRGQLIIAPIAGLLVRAYKRIGKKRIAGYERRSGNSITEDFRRLLLRRPYKAFLDVAEAALPQQHMHKPHARA